MIPLAFYLAKTECKFKKPVVPGDQLRIEVTTVKMTTKAGFLGTKAYVKEDLAAEATIGFGVREV